MMASEIRKLNQMLKEKDKDYFGLRWLCRRFGISPNGYYNYLKDTKGEYHEQRAAIFERIKYIYYNNNRTVGHRAIIVKEEDRELYIYGMVNSVILAGNLLTAILIGIAVRRLDTFWPPLVVI